MEGSIKTAETLSPVKTECMKLAELAPRTRWVTGRIPGNCAVVTHCAMAQRQLLFQIYVRIDV